MNIVDVLARPTCLVYDGPMETRIEYGTELKLDQEMSIFTLCESEEGREALATFYRRDVEAAHAHGVPIILNAPTYRASPSHATRLGCTGADAIDRINRAALDLVRSVRDESNGERGSIYLTAPVGPKHAAYHPALEFTLAEAAEYHAPQAHALEKWGPDLVSIAAMPGAVEARGAARAVARTGLPYTVGFILNAQGTLLDGTPPDQLIEDIESSPHRPPLFYVLGCTHPTVCAWVLDEGGPALARVMGIKANGSSLDPQALLALDRAVADDPEEFADSLLALGARRGFRIYGGCCGTDTAHVESLARRLANMNANPPA